MSADGKMVGFSVYEYYKKAHIAWYVKYNMYVPDEGKITHNGISRRSQIGRRS